VDERKVWSLQLLRRHDQNFFNKILGHQ
jgi:hypothetical protein